VDFNELPARVSATLNRNKLILSVLWWRNQRLITWLGIAVIATGMLGGFYSQQEEEIQPGIALSSFPITIPTMGWGFALDTLQVANNVIEEGQSLSDLLAQYDIPSDQALQLINNAGEVFDLRSMRAGKPLIVLSKD